MQALIPPTQADLDACAARLADAKESHDECQADLRQARGSATAAAKELATALRNWRSLYRQAHGQAVSGDDDPDEYDDEPGRGA